MGVKLTGGEAEKHKIIALLAGHGLGVIDLTDNEAAKLHVRYMVGGRVRDLTDELVYRFQFPERPGALLKFLEGLNDARNISLFHYRNHRADYGRVLASIHVPDRTRAAFIAHIDAVGFPYWDEADNLAYRQFL
ncbi:MAG: hypothetical protein MO852_06090 [Candidatus Devosia euplotis]|nr:hypothetical protein [Candidatus Devosia euplotis]